MRRGAMKFVNDKLLQYSVKITDVDAIVDNILLK